MNTDLKAKLASILAELNAKLPAGIIAKEAWFGPQLVIQYHVRYMQDGKRYSVGVFLTIEAAIHALINHKVQKMIVVDASHRARLEQLYLSLANQGSTDIIEQAAIISTSGKGLAVHSLNIPLMEAFMQSRPAHEIEEKKDYDFYWSADAGGDNKMYKITSKMIFNYYRKLENDLAMDSPASTELKDTEKAEIVNPQIISKHKSSELSELPELSDEEYNKLLGLDDPD